MTLDEYFPSIDKNPESFTIVAVCVSTYQGNPAPSAKQSFDWLSKLVARLENGEKELSSLLTNMHYFVFGCGNMNWAATYNKVGSFFDENLQKLGAKRMCPPGFHDEGGLVGDDDLEEAFAEFYKVMAPALMHSIPEIGEKRLREVDASAFASKPTVQAQAASSAFQMDILGDADTIGAPDIVPTTVNKKVYRCPIKKMVDITPNADRSTLHIEFELQEGMKYRAGDHLAICPVMPKEIVDRVLSMFYEFHDESTIVRWSPQFDQSRKTRFHLPMSTPMTLENIFSNLLDLKAVPTKQFLVNLATIVKNPEHADELKSIASDLKGYKQWITDNTPISNVDVIERYPPNGNEIRRLIEFLPVIKPRPYSICSSPKLDSSIVAVCVGVVEDNYENGKSYHGVSSSYLKSLLNDYKNSACHCYIECADEAFDVPKDDSKSIILISAGTGFAPMRSFLQERQARNASGKIFNFFGCRSEDTDWLYSDELQKYQESGLLTAMFVGFSRSKNIPRAYVQNKIAEQADLVWNALEDGAYIYVCGSGSRVGVGARDSLLKIIQDKSGKSMEYAEKYITNLSNTGRYEQDVWG